MEGHVLNIAIVIMALAIMLLAGGLLYRFSYRPYFPFPGHFGVNSVDARRYTRLTCGALSDSSIPVSLSGASSRRGSSQMGGGAEF